MKYLVNLLQLTIGLLWSTVIFGFLVVVFSMIYGVIKEALK